MKQCPSCSNLIEEALAVCPHCGNAFDGEETSKKTMMGIPGIDASSLRSKDEKQQASAGRSTMFGLPAQRVQQNTPVQHSTYANVDDHDDGATQVVAGDLASAFDFGGEGPSLHIAQDQQRGESVRTTSPGGLPSIKSAHQQDKTPMPPRAPDPWGLGEESSSEGNDATVVASANLFDGASSPDPREQSGFSQFRGPVHSAPRKHETLMGMNLDELTGSARQTMFSMPSPMGDGLSEASEEIDAPTQAMSGAVANAFIEQVEEEKAKEEDNRRRLLQKLRSNSKSSDEKKDEGGSEEVVRSTMFGIPSIDLDAHSEPTAARSDVDDLEDADEVDSRMTPNTGVLKVRKRRPNLSTEGRPPSGSTGVLGGSSYIVNKDDMSDNRVETPEASKERKSPGLRLDIPKPAEPEIEEGVPPASITSLGADSEEEPFERTRVASGELAQAQLAKMQSFGSKPAPPNQQGDASTQIADASLAASLQHSSMLDASPSPPPEEHIDATREQNLSDLRAKLRDSIASKDETSSPTTVASAQAIADAGGFDADATRQQNIDDFRAKLGSGLFDKPDNDAGAGGARFSIPSAFGSSEKPAADFEETIEKAPAVMASQPLQPDPVPVIADVEPLPLEIVEPRDPFGAQEPPAADNALSAQLFGEEEVDPEGYGQDPFSQSGHYGASPEPVHTPMLEPAFQADPIQPEPHFESSFQQPQQQHLQTPQQPAGQGQAQAQGQQQQQPAASTDKGKDSPGRIFQVVFGVLALLAFGGATAVGFSTAGGVPEDPMAMAVVFGPAGLALLALIGCVIPNAGARAGVLVLTGLLGIGIFALGLTMGAAEGVLGLVILLVAVLLCFAAAGFPAIAKAIS